MRINENIPALNAYNALTRTNAKIDTAMRRLSSGYRINSVKDDSAGLAISNKLHSQILGLDKAERNSMDGISAVQTAEGATQEIHNMLQRIRELAVQASNDTNEPEDRKKMHDEVEALLKEIDSITQRTEFNQIKLLNGDAQRLAKGLPDFVGISKVTYISENVPVGDMNYTIVSAGVPASVNGTGSDFSVIPAGSFKINGEEMKLTGIESSAQAVEKLKELCDRTNIEIMVLDGKTWDDYIAGDADIMLYTMEQGSRQYIDISGNDELVAMFGLTAGKTNGIDAVITDYTMDGVNFSAVVDGNKIMLTGANNQKVTIELQFDGRPDENGNFSFKNGDLINNDGTIDSASSALNPTKAEITNFGMLILQIGANKTQELTMQINSMTCHDLGIEFLNIKSLEDAQKAINQCEEAISKVSSASAYLGAYQNRLEYTGASLRVSSENMSTARSRIMDTDMAWEMTELTKNNVIAQAGMSIMAQANQRPQQILQLLQ